MLDTLLDWLFAMIPFRVWLAGIASVAFLVGVIWLFLALRG